MDFIVELTLWLNAAANAVGRLLLAPIGLLPGWLSATAVAAVTGLLMLVAFKHTSNQRAIKAARDDIKAQLLALKLFRDSVGVAMRAQGRILLAAGRLLLLAVVPMLVMAGPVFLLLAQLALWYQARPLHLGEEAVLTMKLGGNVQSGWPRVSLQPTEAMDVTLGPVRVLSKRELCWNIRARAAGGHRLMFDVDGQTIDKELAIGDGFMRVSAERPGWSWSDALLNPCEPPLGPESPVHSIAIDYPRRSSWIYGSDSWVIYWFAASMVAAFFFRRVVGVNL
jgi:hypothetical protein